ncbi:MAG: acetate kinase, partial [Clostridiales bacterium]|nr:acetate kinase [Clostridiales bacterium]
LQGLLMGTRCGDIDPAIVAILMEKENLTPAQVSDLMNKKSGLLGLSGVSSDFRYVEEAALAGNKRAALAIDVFYQSILRYVGAYIAELGGLDALVFTAGIGENSISARAALCRKLAYLGIELDEEANACRGKEAEISKKGSAVRVFVIPTNEELMIAMDTRDVLLRG